MISVKQRQPFGFTLFELLLALTIVSVMSTIGATGFFKLTTYWNDLLLTQRSNHIATEVFAAMAADFENTLSAEVTDISLHGQRSDFEDNRRFWRLDFEDDQISLPVEAYNPALGAWERRLVRFRIDRTDGEPRLLRYARPLDAGPSAEKQTASFAGVTGMRIHYFDGETWRNEWQEKFMPDAVRVSLAIMEDRRVDKHLARMATFRIYVN